MTLQEAVTLFDEHRQPDMFAKPVLFDDLVYTFGANEDWLDQKTKSVEAYQAWFDEKVKKQVVIKSVSPKQKREQRPHNPN